MGLAGHWWILLILAAIALIIFGPSRLPELGSGLGRAIKEFRRATSDVSEGFKEEMRKTEASTTPSPPAEAGSQPAPPSEAPKA